MFGHKDKGVPDPNLAGELAATGERVVAAILSQSPHDVRDHSVEWHFVVNVSAGGKWHKVNVVQRLPDAYDFRTGEMNIPVIFDPADPSRIVVDTAALSGYEAAVTAEATANRQAALRAELGIPVSATPRWVVPDHCPNCGAVVDQALMSEATDPRCTFCHEPLPVQPGSAAPPS